MGLIIFLLLVLISLLMHRRIKEPIRALLEHYRIKEGLRGRFVLAVHLFGAFRRRLFLQSEPSRAVWEALGVTGIYFGILGLANLIHSYDGASDQSPGIIQSLLRFFFYAKVRMQDAFILSGLIYALRAKTQSTTWPKDINAILRVYLKVPPFIIVVTLIPEIILAFYIEGWLDRFGFLLIWYLVAIVSGFVVVGFIRLLIWFGIAWNTQRKKQLGLELIHSQLVVAGLITMIGLLISISVGLIDLSIGDHYLSGSPTQTVTAEVIAFMSGFVSLLAQFLFVAIVVLAVVLPPTAFISRRLAKRLISRLEALVDTSRRLREGDYEARVEVSGNDEIAQLQSDINATASELQRVMSELAQKQRLLELEQEKAERLLTNILPGSIATRLKEDQHPIADGFAEVTVLFADIVDFTRLSAMLGPDALVTWLNDIFSAFDGLAEKYGLEKIKTIGDAYMVVGGVPEARPDHAEAIAEMALDMQAEIADRYDPLGNPIQMRIGINSGSVVAGVIGKKKFIYDLWGDAVNTASRMESYGLAGTIQVTEETYHRIKGRFSFQDRGSVYIKGKGKLQTYLLLDRIVDGGTSN